MKVIGITGGIGCGKSEVCRYLQKKYDAEIIMADDVARDVTRPGTSCHGKLIELLGDDCFLEDGSLDRKKTGAVAFKNPDILHAMNDIIHPAVWDEIQKRLKEAQEAQKKLAVIEAALLVGSSYREICSEFWYIYADKDVRIERLMQSRKMEPDRVLDIMKNQPTEEEFRNACEFTLDNSGDFSATSAMIDKRIAKGESI